jgi:hypothetical protein
MSQRLRRPQKIMVIRHAEKPRGELRHCGVTLEGKREKECLTVRGWQRAGALASFFAPLNGSFSDPTLARPQHLFASKPTKRNGSRRPMETITPLAEKLAIKINSEFLKFDTEKMLDDVFLRAGVVLICWQQEFIPNIANYILGSKKMSPQDWPDDRFDMVWVFERDTLTDHYSFHQVPQCLLIGDLTTPIK